MRSVRESIVGGCIVRTLRLPDDTFETTVIHGYLSGEKWQFENLSTAISGHDMVVNLVRIVSV